LYKGPDNNTFVVSPMCPYVNVSIHLASNGSEGLGRLIKKVGLTCTHLITEQKTGQLIQATKKPLLLRWLGYLNESKNQLTEPKILDDLVKQFQIHSFNDIEKAIEFSKTHFAANGNKRLTFILNDKNHI
ncbi:MAG: hypothetical protein AAFZ15_34330, partial [Bacteroidota bacterium]